MPGKFVDRKVVCDKIIKVLKLGKEKRTRPAEAKVKMNLHRLNQLLWYCHFRWDGARWRGGNLRSKVVELCRVKYNMDGQRKLSDNQLLGFACDDSSMFCGLCWTWRSASPSSPSSCGRRATSGLSFARSLAFMRSSPRGTNRRSVSHRMCLPTRALNHRNTAIPCASRRCRRWCSWRGSAWSFT